MKMRALYLVGFLIAGGFSQSGHTILFSGDKGNGGDETGVEFEQAYEKALAFLKSDLPKLYKQLDQESCAGHLTTSSKPKVIGVAEKLELAGDGFIQSGVALNFPSSQTILVNRARWKAIADP